VGVFLRADKDYTDEGYDQADDAAAKHSPTDGQ
jgi:hypothetical protein